MGRQSDTFFPRVEMSKTRTSSFKVRGAKFKGAVHKVVGDWNTMPGVVGEAVKRVAFYRLLSRHMDMQEIQADEISLALWIERCVFVIFYVQSYPMSCETYIFKYIFNYA